MDFSLFFRAIIEKISVGKIMYTLLLTLILYLTIPAESVNSLIVRKLPFGSESISLLSLLFVLSYVVVDIVVILYKLIINKASPEIERRKKLKESKNEADVFLRLSNDEKDLIAIFLSDNFKSKELDHSQPEVMSLLNKKILLPFEIRDGIKFRSNTLYSINPRMHKIIREIHLKQS